MFGLIALLVLLLPVAELLVVIRVGSVIGGLQTLALLVLVSMLGLWLVKRAGLGLLARAQRELQAGRAPGVGLVDGILLLVAGGLLLVPGFITDALGVLLLLPPVRVLVRRRLMGRYRRRAQLYRDGVRVRESRFGRVITVVDVRGGPPAPGTGPGGGPPELEP